MTEGFNPTPVTASQKLKDAMTRWNQNIEGVDADVLARFEASLDALKAKGYELVDIELPSPSLALSRLRPPRP